MSYSIMINSNSVDASNLTKTRDLLNNLVNSCDVDEARIAGLDFDIKDISKLAKWSNELVKLMNVSGSPEDVYLEPLELI